MDSNASAPILSAEATRQLEAGLFAGDESKEWAAMRRAGGAVGEAALNDFREIAVFPGAARLLVLVGKGHNGGDALIAAQTILERNPGASADVLLAFGERALKPLAMRAHRELVQAAPGRVNVRGAVDQLAPSYDVCLDGVFGFQFRPPVDTKVAAVLAHVNALPIRLRAAVDLPSALGEAQGFRADFTYATGVVKVPLLADKSRGSSGRIRYLDLEFFKSDSFPAVADRVLTSDVLASLRGLRSPLSEKRRHGHLLVVGGSRSFSGAIMMSVQAALRSGVGLLTAFVPESLAPAFAAQVPEAMWVGWPETSNGGLALEGLHLLRERSAKATGLLIGPGLATEAETLALAVEIVKSVEIPVVLDADALRPEIVRAGSGVRVLTPHAGEYARLAGEKDLRAYSADAKVVTVLKGPSTQVSDGGKIYHSFFGGPVLARGGSGDLLAGMIGGLLAQQPNDALLAACQGVAWHGLAADLLARSHGQTAVHTMQLLDFLPTVLRGESA